MIGFISLKDSNSACVGCYISCVCADIAGVSTDVAGVRADVSCVGGNSGLEDSQIGNDPAVVCPVTLRSLVTKMVISCHVDNTPNKMMSTPIF